MSVDVSSLAVLDADEPAASVAKSARVRARTPGPQRFRNPAAREWTFTTPERAVSWPQTEWTSERLLAELAALPTADTSRNGPVRQRRAVQLVLDWLVTKPGDTWQQRWLTSGADDAGSGWPAPVLERTPGAASDKSKHWLITSGMNQLLALQVIRPGYPWLYAQKSGGAILAQIRDQRDPVGFATLAEHLRASGRTCGRDQAIAFNQLSRMLVRNGGTLAQVSVDDCLEADHAMRQAREARCAGLYYDLLLETGLLPASSPPTLSAAKRRPLTVDELVDGYDLACRPIRDLIVAYLRERQGALDYSSLKGLARMLAMTFWRDLELNHPGIDSLQLTPQVATAWKERLGHIRHGAKSIGAPRLDPMSVLLAVRAFYSDIAHWALDDPAQWAEFAAPNPIRSGDTAAQTKLKRRQQARMHQRTRALAPVLPRLVETVNERRKAAQRRLSAAVATAHGQAVTVDGHAFARHIVRADATTGAGQGSGRIYAIDAVTGKRRDFSFEEDDAFWAWAIVEVLRHTGIRIEELLELTHHSFAAYRLPRTGEVIPLLQIAPSKADSERLLVVSPELAEVLTAIIFRVRGGRPALPLTPRYDPRECLTSAPAPFLFQRRFGPYQRVISDAHVGTILQRAVAATGLLDAAGQPLSYRPHDFRRIFATEAVAAGLPLPILAKLMGHANIATTEGYAAIYPADVIEHHRTFINRRRSLRPAAEYRQPTEQEWDEFLDHFEKRKVELGVCGRAYGTACQHEHACIRCPMLRPDPKQEARLIEITENLAARLSEAERQGWLGEIEGIKISLAGAEQKLDQMRRTPATQGAQPVTLGLPVFADNR